ncbi:hypothetical protein [Rufibacter sp. LB8]|uniref:hypothetical protein n=1 Tax=Rufibacter sp. LB8 TaxID=2777781 RepID=UPI00178C583A|nr:hypothetical protein [Rufibacter sp. LB8]
MKKTFLTFALAAGMVGFTACDSANENRAEDKAEQMEDAADDADNPAAEERAEELEDSVDAVDPQ